MLTPHIKDANRKEQLKRKALQPDRFGGEPLQGDARVKAQKEIDTMDAAAEAKALADANS